MRWQAEAQRVCREVLAPALVSQGFSGAFPSWHRLGRDCVECVGISVFVRGGVQVALGSTAWRARLDARSPARDASACARTTTLKGFVPIDSRSHLAALPAALKELAQRVSREGAAFWRDHRRELAWRTLLEQISAAVEQGDARRLRALLDGARRKEAQAALDAVRVQQWHRLPGLARLLPLAPVLIAWRPPSLLGAALVVAALREGCGSAALLAWGRRWVSRVRSLGAQLAIFTDHLLAAGEVEVAAQVFELIVGRCALDAPYLGNALWCVIDGNGSAPNPARARRLLRAALRVAPNDAAVRFNAACLTMAQGAARAAEAHLVAAIRAGLPRDQALGEPRVRSLLQASAVRAALRRRVGLVGRGGFVTHAPAARR